MVQLESVFITHPYHEADSSVNYAQVFCFSISWYHRIRPCRRMCDLRKGAGARMAMMELWATILCTRLCLLVYLFSILDEPFSSRSPICHGNSVLSVSQWVVAFSVHLGVTVAVSSHHFW